MEALFEFDVVQLLQVVVFWLWSFAPGGQSHQAAKGVEVVLGGITGYGATTIAGDDDE